MITNPQKEELLTELLIEIKSKETGSINYQIPERLTKGLSTYLSMKEDFQFLRGIILSLSRLKKLTSEHNNFEIDHVLLPGLWYALISIYGRNFTDASKSKKPKLEIKECYNESMSRLKELHDELMELRHTYISHRGINNEAYSIVYLMIPIGEDLEPNKFDYKIKTRKLINPHLDKLKEYDELFIHLLSIIEEKVNKCTSKMHYDFVNSYTIEEIERFVI